MPSFGEEEYVVQGAFHNRRTTDILQEWRTVREATIPLLNSLTPASLQDVGSFKNQPTTALSIACIILGHVNHHINILHKWYKV